MGDNRLCSAAAHDRAPRSAWTRPVVTSRNSWNCRFRAGRVVRPARPRGGAGRRKVLDNPKRWSLGSEAEGSKPAGRVGVSVLHLGPGSTWAAARSVAPHLWKPDRGRGPQPAPPSAASHPPPDFTPHRPRDRRSAHRTAPASRSAGPAAYGGRPGPPARPRAMPAPPRRPTAVAPGRGRGSPTASPHRTTPSTDRAADAAQPREA